MPRSGVNSRRNDARGRNYQSARFKVSIVSYRYSWRSIDEDCWPSLFLGLFFLAPPSSISLRSTIDHRWGY
jgi:hypothetical protein